MTVRVCVCVCVCPPSVTPPVTGRHRFGTEEDSMGSFHNVGYPPYRMHGNDFKQFMELDGQVLRFEAQIVTERPEDIGRYGTISRVRPTLYC